MPFAKTIKNKFVRAAPVLLKSSVIALLCMPDRTVAGEVNELKDLNVMGMTGSLGGRGQVATINKDRVDSKGEEMDKMF